MKTITIDLCTVQEAKEQNPKLYKKIIEKHSDINTDFNWYDDTIDVIKEDLETIGFDNVEINFSGFGSQGDGARFIGTWTALLAEKPKGSNFLSLYETLKETAEKFPGLRVYITTEKHSRYSHENTVSFEFEQDSGDEISEEAERSITETCKEAMRKIYKELEADYDYRTSEEAIVETLDANEYYFDPEGRIRNE